MTTANTRKLISGANDPDPFANSLFAGIRHEQKTLHPDIVKDVFYDPAHKHYLYRAQDGTYIALALADVKRRLKERGISNRLDPVTELSAIDDCISYVQDYQSVQYAGALAGYPCGLLEQNGHRILVTSEAKPFEIKEGSFDVLSAFLEGLLGHDEKQLDAFLYWWRGIIFEKAKPRQALVIAGDAGSGKSLLQQLITHTLGGRSAKPYRYLTGRTEFNSELFGAEHLVIDDESASTDYRSRESLGNQIKQIVVGSEHSHHGKGRDAITLSPFWVISFTLNKEAENLQVLPRMERSLEDKILLLQARAMPMPMPTGTGEERKAFWDRLRVEASGLLHALKISDVPAESMSQRYIVKAYHHPELLRALSNISKEAELLDLIDTHVRLPFRGTAAKLDGILREFSSRQCDQLFNFPNACAVLLGRLEKLYPDRVEKERTKTERLWCIKPELMAEEVDSVTRSAG
jgi:hypothetical protein